jgi:uncharacterized protein YceK
MMRIRVLLVLGLTLLAAGCGSSGTETAATTAETTTAATTTQPEQMALTIYRVEGGALHATQVQVPKTEAVAGASLKALGVDAPVTISNGTATVQLDSATDEQIAEIVYTLTQFSTIQRVDVAGKTGLTRDSVAAFVPPILIDTPPAGATVSSSFQVAGTASVFEATLVVQLVQDGKVVEKKTVTASEGAPGRGTFSTTLHGTAGAATVQAFAPSAEDGSPQHQVDVPITLAAG